MICCRDGLLKQNIKITQTKVEKVFIIILRDWMPTYTLSKIRTHRLRKIVKHIFQRNKIRTHKELSQIID